LWRRHHEKSSSREASVHASTTAADLHRTARKTLSVDEVMGAIVDAVGVFAASRRDDDLTVLVVRRTCRR
jgi:hypothetical protein